MIQSAVLAIPNQQIYKSWHRHDYVSFELNGQQYFLDGGPEDYIRTNIPFQSEDFQWLFIEDDADVEVFIEKYVYQNENKQNVFIKDMDNNELSRARKRPLHPRILEAMGIIISRRISVLDI